MTAQLTSGFVQKPVFREKFPVKRPLSGNYWSETGSYLTAHTTIQSSRTAETVADQNQALSAGILDAYF
jgi:hypothetical protein